MPDSSVMITLNVDSHGQIGPYTARRTKMMDYMWLPRYVTDQNM